MTVLLRHASERVRQIDPDRGPLALLADDFETPPVSPRNMFGDGQAEAGAANRAAAAEIDAVEAFGQARDVLGRNPLALVDHPYAQHTGAGLVEPDPHRRS